MSDAKAPLVFETKGGLSVSYRGRLLYSAREPERLPKRIAAACDKGPARLHLVPSPLLWYGLPELLASMGPGSAALCVEADPLLAELARSRLPPQLANDDRLAFAQTTSPEEAIEAARRMGCFRACSLVPISGGEALNAGAYQAMAAALAAEFESSWRNRAALMVLGDRWARNIFDNLASLSAIGPESLPRFPGAVVVCGAGPSLEEAIPLLVRARSRLGIVACDTALGTLLSSGLEPDLVVCLEGQAHNLPDFTCLGSRRMALAADLSSHPATFRAIHGPKHLTLVRITSSPFLSRVEAALARSGMPFLSAPPLGSVGVHAVHIAGLVARGPVFAAGLDFSFEPGKTHARGCPSLLAEEAGMNRLKRWPGQYAASFRDRTIVLEERGCGATSVLSDPILLSYASLLAERSGAQIPEFYDLRNRGPHIGGSRMTIAEAESFLDSREGQSSAVSGAAALRAETGEGGHAATIARAIPDLLGDELRRLEVMRLSMRGTELLERAEFRRLVLESDYLWWSFPDQHRARELPQDFLNRLVPQVEFWHRRIEGLATPPA